MRMALCQTLVALVLISVAGRSSLAAPQPLFADDTLLQVALSAPLSSVLRERDSAGYFTGNLSYRDESGAIREVAVRIRARGNFRRRQTICEFPPLRLNFVTKDMAGTVFEGQDKLKLVTHCRTGSPRFEQLILKEHLAYRMLQTLTPNSFYVRLLRISWQDTDSGDKPFERYGFLIEDEDLLADRIGLPTANVSHTFPADLDGKQAALIGVFEYMIGNTDFSMLRGPEADDCCHNAVLLANGDGLLPVPYDFDYSGLVDAPYAVPNPRLKIRNVRTRLYRGRCEHNSLLDETLSRFRNAQADIMQLVATQDGLSKSVRRSTRRYIEKFYDDIDDPKQVDKLLTQRCI